MSLKFRILVFTGLWLLAGLAWAIFADFSVEAGESKLAAQAQMVCLAPLCAAGGLAFVVVPGGYNAWPDRQFWEAVVACLFLGTFAAHAAVTLTRKTRRGFVLWTAVQIGFLIASIASVLYYWHWDALHMHG